MGLMAIPNTRVDFTDHRLEWPAFSSEKVDGWRCLVFNGDVFTASGRPFRNANLRRHLAEIIGLSRSCDMVLDGELYHPALTFDELSGVLASKAGVVEGFTFHCFDMLTLGEWIANRALLFGRRLLRLQSFLADYHPANVRTVEQRIVSTPGEARRHFEEITSRGGEGTVIRSADGRYCHGRAKSGIWKFRHTTTEDGKVLAITEAGLPEILLDGQRIAVQVAAGVGMPAIGQTVEVSRLSVDGCQRQPLIARLRLDK